MMFVKDSMENNEAQARRRCRWQSLITNLEDECNCNDDDANNGDADDDDADADDDDTDTTAKIDGTTTTTTGGAPGSGMFPTPGTRMSSASANNDAGAGVVGAAPSWAAAARSTASGSSSRVTPTPTPSGMGMGMGMAPSPNLNNKGDNHETGSGNGRVSGNGKSNRFSSSFRAWSASGKIGGGAGGEISLQEWIASHRRSIGLDNHDDDDDDDDDDVDDVAMAVGNDDEQLLYPDDLLSIKARKRRAYLEQTAQVLHSLVTKIVGAASSSSNTSSSSSSSQQQQQQQRQREDVDDNIVIHPKFIHQSNVIVSRAIASGQILADFAHTGDDDSAFHNEGDGEDATRKKYLALNALGRMAYGMVMMGEGPDVSEFCRPAQASSGNGSLIGADRLSSAPGPDGDDCGDHRRGTMATKTTADSRATETAAAEATTTIDIDDEREIIDMLRKSARMTTSEESDGRGGLAAAMLGAGAPFPACRLVSDLLGAGAGGLDVPSSSSSEGDRGSFSSLADVLSDLGQMSRDPDGFLHASSPDRWRLRFSGTRLYGRGGDTKAFLDAAERVRPPGADGDPLFEGLSRLGGGRRREVVMVSGHSGAGKSRLVRSGGALLEGRGWRLLGCKFDRVVHPEPLSIIAYAFDEYFVPYSANPNAKGSHEVSEHLKSSLSPRGLEILAKHIPSLRLLLGVAFPNRTVEVNETQMASLFGRLLQALSSRATPVLLFVDDLQWADPLSLALITALIKGAGTDLLSWYHSSAEEGQKHENGPREDTNVMFVGSYRDNEVDDHHPLARVLSLLEADRKVNVTNISLSRFTLETMNEMLSDTLFMPIRRVRSLSELVMQKTDGQPLHVIEFIQALTMDNLLTHSFARGWEWDADSIDICPMTDSVAELFTYKLRSLPKEVLLGLQILSVFGSQIDQHVVSYVSDYDGENSVDIPAAIKVALGNGFVEQAARLVSFSHDMIQKATLDSIGADDLVPLLGKLAVALINNASAVDDLDSVVFVVVDLINRIGRDATPCPNQQTQFANLNLRAGAKAIGVPDFSAAAKYAECGMAFLSDDCWRTQYELTLNLYETAVLANFSSQQGNRDLLKERMDAIFTHGKNFSDKFKTHCVWVKLLSMTDLQGAIEECLKALDRLGEPLDLSNVDLKVTGQEVMAVKEQFSGEKENIFHAANRLTDCNKERAMKVMSSLILYYHQQSSFLAPYVSCQMMKLTMTYGHCVHSVFGAAAFASVLVNTLEDIDEGSAWGRATLSLMNMYDKEALMPFIYGPLYGLVFIWKEPLQLQLEPLAQGIRSSFAKGDVEFVFVNTVYYVSRSFFSGKNIQVLLGEVQALARQHGNNFGSTSSDKLVVSPLLQYHLSPAYNTLCALEGENTSTVEEVSLSSSPLDMFTSNTDEIMQTTLDDNRLGAIPIIVAYQALKSFMLRDMDSALKYTNIYMEKIELKKMPTKYSCASIWNTLYEALITFHFARQTGEDKYRERGETAMLKMKKWSRHSDWNFKNKLLLIESEFYNTIGDVDKAALCYEASIKSAQEHKFKADEALANELAGIFHYQRDNHLKSYTFFTHSIECYEEWGANAVAKRVDDSLSTMFDSEFIPNEITITAPTGESDKATSKKRQHDN